MDFAEFQFSTFPEKKYSFQNTLFLSNVSSNRSLSRLSLLLYSTCLPDIMALHITIMLWQESKVKESLATPNLIQIEALHWFIQVARSTIAKGGASNITILKSHIIELNLKFLVFKRKHSPLNPLILANSFDC